MPLTRLPPKRLRPKSGIERGPQREWPRHRKFVRSHGCCVPGCQHMDIEFAHVRSAANSGTGFKPHDAFAISLCRVHHREQHQIGQRAFEKTHGIDMMALANAFMRRSPDTAMRESLKLMEPSSPSCGGAA